MEAIFDIVEAASACDVLELAGYSDAVLNSPVQLFITFYNSIRRKRAFTAVEKTKISNNLPGVQTILKAVKNVKYVQWALKFRSFVEFVCDDFAEMEELKYSPFIVQLDERIVEWKVKLSTPFLNHRDYRYTKAMRMPSSHSWCFVWRGVTAIGGIPIEQLDAEHEAFQRMWKNYNQKKQEDS